MNRKRIILIFVLLWGVLLAASLAKKRLFKSPPPGTIMLTDSLYIDKGPVRTVDYLEFLSAIRNSYSPKMHDSLKRMPRYGIDIGVVTNLQEKMKWDSIYYIAMLPRTWITYANDIKKYDVDYHIKNPKYYNYPVINLNYMQLTEYCKWRTDMVKIHYAVISSTEKQRRKYPMNFEYRLPTKKDWDKAMGKFFESVVKLEKLTSVQNNTINNIAAPYESKKGFQYDSRNVGEMLDRFVITVGFAWDEEFAMGNINYIKYDEPSDWVGFRCVCEIIPEKGRKKKTVEVKRDKFGKIIKEPKNKKKKETKPAKENTNSKTKKTKTKKAKSKKTKTESISKKRRKR